MNAEMLKKLDLDEVFALAEALRVQLYDNGKLIYTYDEMYAVVAHALNAD